MRWLFFNFACRTHLEGKKVISSEQMMRSLCSESVKLSKDPTALRLWRNINSFPHCFMIHLPSKLQIALFTASVTFNLVMVLLISELKMETLHHYLPLKKRLIVFCWDEEHCVTAVTQTKASEAVVESRNECVGHFWIDLLANTGSLRKHSQAVEIDVAARHIDGTLNFFFSSVCYELEETSAY